MTAAPKRPSGRSRRLRAGEEDGITVLWFLLMTTAILTLGVASVDMWAILTDYRAVAEAADAGSVAGAAQLDTTRFRDSGGEVVRLDADAGFRIARDTATTAIASAGKDDAEVRVQTFVPTGDSASGGSVTVTVTRTVPTIFLGLVALGQEFTVDSTSTSFTERGRS